MLRVRTLESERAFKRVASAQKAIGDAVMTGTLVNLATVFYINSIRMPAMAAYIKIHSLKTGSISGNIIALDEIQRDRITKTANAN